MMTVSCLHLGLMESRWLLSLIRNNMNVLLLFLPLLTENMNLPSLLTAAMILRDLNLYIVVTMFSFPGCIQPLYLSSV